MLFYVTPRVDAIRPPSPGGDLLVSGAPGDLATPRPQPAATTNTGTPGGGVPRNKESAGKSSIPSSWFDAALKFLLERNINPISYQSYILLQMIRCVQGRALSSNL